MKLESVIHLFFKYSLMDVFQFFRKIFVKLELQSTKRKIIQLQITERQFLPNMYHIAITIVIYLKLSCHFLSLSLFTLFQPRNS